MLCTENPDANVMSLTVFTQIYSQFICRLYIAFGTFDGGKTVSDLYKLKDDKGSDQMGNDMYHLRKAQQGNLLARL